MKIDVRSNESLYIEINGWTYYIDDSTDEQIIKKWRTMSKIKIWTDRFGNEFDVSNVDEFQQEGEDDE